MGAKSSKPAPKKEEPKNILHIFSKKPAPPPAPEPEPKFKEALPVVGVAVLLIAVGTYLYKKKPWAKK